MKIIISCTLLAHIKSVTVSDPFLLMWFLNELLYLVNVIMFLHLMQTY